MKPILFSTPMVQAILEGRKTMTRRVCKPLTLNYPMRAYDDETPEEWLARWRHKPIYSAGDILWVRETWAEVFGNIEYRADFSDDENHYRAKRYGKVIARWRPSIHMPREAARIFLHVTNVRVERLQDIAENDARAEGCREIRLPGIVPEDCGAVLVSARGRFHALWDSLSAKRGYGWDTNPWVWVIEFERVGGAEHETR